MAAHLPRLPFLLLVFLAVQAPASHGNPDMLLNSYDASMCGSVNITYPFYLSNKIRETSSYGVGYYSCGYTDLKITCEGEGASARPVIRLGGENYTVQDISYDYESGIDGYKVILADSEVLVGGNCPAVRHGVSFDEVWLHNTSSNGNLTFYLGCYPPGGGHMPPELEKYQIDCNEFKSPVLGGGVAFVFTPDDHEKAQKQDLSANCKAVFSVLVKNDVLKKMANDWTNFKNGGYGYVLKQGFELEWSRIATDQCPLCEQSGGKCAYSQNKKFLGCLCSDRKVSYTDCRPSDPF